MRVLVVENDRVTALGQIGVALEEAGAAIRIGRAVYGTQFHFEASRAVVDIWAATFPEMIAALSPGWLEARGRLADEHGPAADGTGLAIARAWVATIAAGLREERRVQAGMS